MNANTAMEKLMVDGNILAIVVRNTFREAGCNFFTPDEFPFQLGIHIREAKTHIQAHKHVPFKELKDIPAQEFFYVEQGKVEVGLFYRDALHSKVVLNKGDSIVLNCAHDVTFLEATKMLELKQGPYRGRDVEKEYF